MSELTKSFNCAQGCSSSDRCYIADMRDYIAMASLKNTAQANEALESDDISSSEVLIAQSQLLSKLQKSLASCALETAIDSI